MRFKKLKIAAALILSAGLACSGAVTALAQETDLPESYSSRELGYVTSVKSQSGNTCWAYATTAAYESAVLRQGFETDSMSPDHLILWATTRTTEKGWLRHPSDNGYPCIGAGYLASWQGGVEIRDLESPLDYSLKGDEIPMDNIRYGVTSIEYLGNWNTDAIKRAIMNHGGAFASYSHNAQFLSADGKSYYMPNDYSGSFSGHSIEVVGWDDNYPREKFSDYEAKMPKSNGAWLIKNSWGESFGDGGYFWMSYECRDIFATRYSPAFAVTGIEEITEDKKLLQNEIYGATYEFDYTGGKEDTFINRFSVDDEYSLIDKVIFETKAENAAYDIYYVPDSDGAPSSDSNTWTLLYSGKAEATGYICADIEDFTVPAGGGSIAVHIDASETLFNSSIGVGEWLTDSGNYVFLNDSARAQSYLLYNGEMMDLMDYYKQYQNDEIGGTFVIKAVAKKPNTLLGDVNYDGVLSIDDATVIQRHLAEFKVLDGQAFINADYNKDGEINIDDVTAIQRHLAGY